MVTAPVLNDMHKIESGIYICICIVIYCMTTNVSRDQASTLDSSNIYALQLQFYYDNASKYIISSPNHIQIYSTNKRSKNEIAMKLLIGLNIFILI